MRKVIRKISAAIVATTITVAMCATCFAGTTFEGYFGQRENWYEGADGSLSGATASSFSADMDAIGWGGVWGAQAHRDITVKKGQKYTLSFKATTTTAEKWVFFKVTDSQDTVVYADWLHLQPGVTENYKATFKASANATFIYYGMGGEFGDRTEEQGDIYALSEVLPNDADSSFGTSVKVTNFKCVKSKAKLKVTKDKKKNGIALYNYLKKNGKIFKQVGDFVCTIQTSGNKIQIKAIQNQEVVADVKLAKNKPQATVKKLRSSIASSAINSALKTETKMTLKNLGY